MVRPLYSGDGIIRAIEVQEKKGQRFKVNGQRLNNFCGDEEHRIENLVFKE